MSVEHEIRSEALTNDYGAHERMIKNPARCYISDASRLVAIPDGLESAKQLLEE